MNERDNILNIVKNLKDSSNKELIFALEFLKKDFDVTKEQLITLTHHFDTVEMLYNKILDEYNNRINVKLPK